MSTFEIKFGGLGGQGVILSAMVTGRAAAIHDGKHATLTQAFGPEARGSSCSAQVIVSTERILYPYVHHPDVLIAMSQDAYSRFAPEVREGGIVLIDQDLVKPGAPSAGRRVYSIPATRIAEELGRRMVLNIVMTGFFTAIVGAVDVEAMRKALRESVPKGTEDLNLKAFERGYEWGKKALEQEKKLAAAPTVAS